MKKSDRFRPIQQLTVAKEQDAAKALGQANQLLDEHEHRLHELQNYRTEYQQQLMQRGQGGFTAAKMMEMRRFLQSLDQAILQQQQSVEVLRKEREKMRQQWQQAHGRTVAMEKVVLRYQEDEAYHQNKREQKESDEMAQRGKRER